MTHNHALDQEIAEALFRRNDFAFFGLIGSKAKRSIFEKRLLAKGVESAKLARMICPIGELTIESKEPMAIALGVAAQLQRHHEAAARCRREHSKGIAFGQQTQELARLPGHFCPASRASA
jgi:xanthine dehydrogenase accessory factor